MYTKQDKLTTVYAIQIKEYVYIGIASNLKKRIAAHKRDLVNNNHHNSIMQKLWNKYQEIDYFILEDNIHRDDIAEAEMFYIAYFKYIGARVINLTNGGEACFGRFVSDATKEKLINSNTGQKRSDAARLNMRNAHLGKKRTPESIAKAAAKNTGKKRTPETCKVLGEVHAKTYKCVLVSPDGTEYSDIHNLTEFARNHNLSRRTLNAVMLGDKKSYRKWRLKDG